MKTNALLLPTILFFCCIVLFLPGFYCNPEPECPPDGDATVTATQSRFVPYSDSAVLVFENASLGAKELTVSVTSHVFQFANSNCPDGIETAEERTVVLRLDENAPTILEAYMDGQGTKCWMSIKEAGVTVLGDELNEKKVLRKHTINGKLYEDCTLACCASAYYCTGTSVDSLYFANSVGLVAVKIAGKWWYLRQ